MGVSGDHGAIYRPKPTAGDWATAGQIEVTVSCVVPLSMFNYIGVTGSHTFTAVAYAPLDPYSYRTSS